MLVHRPFSVKKDIGLTISPGQAILIQVKLQKYARAQLETITLTSPPDISRHLSFDDVPPTKPLSASCRAESTQANPS